MPTTPGIAIDAVGIAKALVDLGFGLGAGASVTATLKIIGARVYNSLNDVMVETGGYTVQDFTGYMYSGKDTEGLSADERESYFMLNASDLVAKGVPPNMQPKRNDKLIVGTVTWTVFDLMPVPTETIYIMRVRR